MDEIQIQLGQKVKDKLTGLEGIVIGITDWLYGCRRITFQPYGHKDGKAFEMLTVDQPQCELVAEEAAPKAAPRHGPRQNVTRY